MQSSTFRRPSQFPEVPRVPCIGPSSSMHSCSCSSSTRSACARHTTSRIFWTVCSTTDSSSASSSARPSYRQASNLPPPPPPHPPSQGFNLAGSCCSISTDDLDIWRTTGVIMACPETANNCAATVSLRPPEQVTRSWVQLGRHARSTLHSNFGPSRVLVRDLQMC